MRVYIAGVIALFLVTSAFSDAFTDLEYTFAGGSLSASGGAADLTASDITVTDSVNMGGSSAGNFFIRGDVTDGDTVLDVASSLFTTSYEPTDYLSWTVTADAGSQLELDQVSFDYWNEGSGGGSSYSVAFALRSSVDGFTSDLAVSDGGYLNGFIPNTDTTAYNAVATLGAEFEGLSSVEFRLYTYGDLGFNASGERGRIDNISHSGATTIPEPATLGLIASFGGGLLFVRRMFLI